MKLPKLIAADGSKVKAPNGWFYLSASIRLVYLKVSPLKPDASEIAAVARALKARRSLSHDGISATLLSYADKTFRVVITHVPQEGVGNFKPTRNFEGVGARPVDALTMALSSALAD